MLPPLDTPDAPIAEIAMWIWTISTRIVQAYMANPSKPGGSLAIFSWTRQARSVALREAVRGGVWDADAVANALRGVEPRLF